MNRDHTNVIVFPPLLYLGALLLGLLIHTFDHRSLFLSNLGRWTGLVMAVFGLWLAVKGRRTLLAAGTSVHPEEPATILVREGPYRYSRNPMYLAMTIGYCGMALIFNALWPAIMLLPLVTVVRFGVIGREEHYLESKFGGEYRNYLSQVRRWL